MSDGPAGPEDPGGDPEVGSLGEEAAKLFGALADAARQHGGDVGDGMSGVAGQAAHWAHEVNDHLATDDVECRYCPICRVVHVVRETSPEVRAHLTTAATSLLHAASELLATLPPPAEGDASPRRPDVEKINLDDGPESDQP